MGNGSSRKTIEVPGAFPITLFGIRSKSLAELNLPPNRLERYPPSAARIRQLAKFVARSRGPSDDSTVVAVTLSGTVYRDTSVDCIDTYTLGTVRIVAMERDDSLTRTILDGDRAYRHSDGTLLLMRVVDGHVRTRVYHHPALWTSVIMPDVGGWLKVLPTAVDVTPLAAQMRQSDCTFLEGDLVARPLDDLERQYTSTGKVAVVDA
jgi:hypothetical protein